MKRQGTNWSSKTGSRRQTSFQARLLFQNTFPATHQTSLQRRKGSRKNTERKGQRPVYDLFSFISFFFLRFGDKFVRVACDRKGVWSTTSNLLTSLFHLVFNCCAKARGQRQVGWKRGLVADWWVLERWADVSFSFIVSFAWRCPVLCLFCLASSVSLFLLTFNFVSKRLTRYSTPRTDTSRQRHAKSTRKEERNVGY